MADVGAAVPGDWFADSLGQQPAVPVMQKPSKLVRFADALASLGGANIDRQGNFMKGVDAGSQYKLRTAQTESALAEAEKRRAEAMGQSQANALRAKVAADPNYMPTVSELLAVANGANDFSNARLGYQEHDQRGLVADPNADQRTRLSTMEAISGRPVERFYDSGTGMQANQINPEAAPIVTPVGQAQIDNYHEKPVGASGAFTLGGVRYDANGKPIVDVSTAAANAAQIAEATARARTGAKSSTTTLPAKVRQAVAQNDGLLASIDAAIAIVEQNPNAFGLGKMLGDAVNQRMDPEGVPARAAIADIGSQKLHDRSGAAVTAKEFPRLTPFIPAITDTPQAIMSKLTSMRDMIRAEQDAILSQNAPPAVAPAAPAAPGAAPPAGGNVMRSVSKSGKPIVSNDGGQTWVYE